MKDHFPLPFINQMLEKVAGHSCYFLLDGYSGYNQIPIASEDVEKTIFTCPSDCLKNLELILERCEATHLVLNWEKCHFMEVHQKLLQHYQTVNCIASKGCHDCFQYGMLKSIQIDKGKAGIQVASNAVGVFLQEFDLEIKDRKGTENQVADHLFRLEKPPVETVAVREEFPDKQIFSIAKISERPPWYADIANYLASG
ncbi:uncharacterized protein LOC142175730 [Nicotiana tabacum]|uniref:Uncharacterized protein LOC142175730 n=1 Tax=Nicotiana tabacum TaxID=4097 RepID=A0AC58TNL3_TOBAC